MIHGVHLAVVDVLYEKKKKKSNTKSSQFTQESQPVYQGDDESSDSEDEDQDACMSYDHVEQESVPDAPEIIPTYFGLLDKTRDKNKEFKNSYVKNDDYLQKLIIENHGREISLKTDMKIRWNSTKDMIRRFLQLLPEIKYATSMSGKDWEFKEAEIKQLRDLDQALEPLECAIKQLGSSGINLIGAEMVYENTWNDFQRLDSPIARQLEQSFKKRLLERRPANLVHLILFLENPSYWDKEKDFFGETIRKSQIKKLASDLVRRLFPEDINQYSSVNDVTFDEDDAPEIFDDSEKEKASVPELTKEQKFNLAWKKRQAESDTCKLQSGDKPTNVGEELDLFAQTRYRTPLLSKLFNALKTIVPSSIESERAFSVTGNFVTKLRTNLGDDTIDALVFLKTHYRNVAAKVFNVSKIEQNGNLFGKSQVPKSQSQLKSKTPSKSQSQLKSKTPSKSQENSDEEINFTPRAGTSRSQNTPKPSSSKSLLTFSPRTPINHPETPRSSKVFQFRKTRKDQNETISSDPAIVKRGTRKDPNMTISGDPAVMKRGRVEHESQSMDDAYLEDSDETQMVLDIST